MVAQGEDPFSDSEEDIAPVVVKKSPIPARSPVAAVPKTTPPAAAKAPVNDPFSSDDDQPLAKDPFSDSDDEGPNPLVAGGEDPFSDSDDEGPNPLVAGGEDPFSDDD